MFLTQLEFKNYEEVEKKEDEFQEVLGTPGKEEEVYKELSLFFSQLTPVERQKYQHTYWRWFTYITWDRLSAISQNDLVDLVDQQLLMAVMLGFDVWQEIMNYFVINTPDEQSAKGLYTKMRSKLFDSEVIVGKLKDKNVTLKEVVERIVRYNRKNISSMEEAEIFAELKNIFFPEKTAPSYMVAVTSDEVVKNIIGLYNFLLGIQVNYIWNFVDYYSEYGFFAKHLYAGEVSRKSVGSSPVATTEKRSLPENKIPRTGTVAPNPAPAPVAAPVAPTSTKPTTNEIKKPMGNDESVAAPAALQKVPDLKNRPVTNEEKKREQPVSLTEIRRQIEARFPKAADGQFMNISEVLRELEKLGTKYKDDRIFDLYCFNEKNGKFEWNDAFFK